MVDKNNQQWLFAAEQILSVLHSIGDTKQDKESTKKWQVFNVPVFSFEIVNYAWTTKFFMQTPKEYKEFLENQIYAHYPDSLITEVKDYLNYFDKDSKVYVWTAELEKNYLYPIRTINDFYAKWDKEFIDPYSSITSVLNKQWNNLKFVQVIFSPVSTNFWQKKENLKEIVDTKLSTVDKFTSSKFYKFLKVLIWLTAKFRNFLLFFINPRYLEELRMKEQERKQKEQIRPEEEKKEEINPFVNNKLSHKIAYKINIKIASLSNEMIAKSVINETASCLSIFNIPESNGFKLKDFTETKISDLKTRNIEKWEIILTAPELAWLVHVPTSYIKTSGISWLNTKFLEPPANLPILWTKNDILPLWITNFRWNNLSFWIRSSDRRRHIYIVWKTWTWKSTLIENMIFDDIAKWRWVALLDPHWDLSENILRNIPKSRTNDVVIFDPSDYEFPVAFNMLENVSKELRPLVASWLVSVFKKLFDSWWPRLEYILRNTILTLLWEPDATLMNIPTILTNKAYRQKVISRLKDPVLLKFWQDEFEPMDRKQKIDAVSPILNKVWQFLSSSTVRNILWQPKNSFSLKWVMDKSKILVVNLSKWKIWEDYSSLLWSLIVTKFQIDAMSRANMEEQDRKDFYLYVDEFQNFATDSFATILSEARKYKLNLVLANQYIGQMSQTVKWAIFGNVGTLISFQTWYEDAGLLCENMWWEEAWVEPSDFVNLRKFDVYVREYLDGIPSSMFSATTLPPIKFKRDKESEQQKEILFKVNREKYARPASFVEDKIMEFSNKVVEMEKKMKEKEQEQRKK